MTKITVYFKVDLFFTCQAIYFLILYFPYNISLISNSIMINSFSVDIHF